jgi:type VI secretion system secreted protein VgrG
MGDELTQDTRIASLTTPLGKDKLLLAAFDATEGLSELFEFCIDALSKDENVDFDQILGRSCCVCIRLGEGPERYFDGIAVEAQAAGMRDDLYAYRLVLRPALWLLTRTSNCRIWHEKTALDVIKDVLQQREIDHRSATTGNFPKLEYCVQYRETDFAFVSRLMEQHGI